jgi:hypothetical protein
MGRRRYALQENSELANSNGWANIATNSPATRPIGPGTKYYRLKK